MLQIKQWVISICTAIFFIVAVEMLLPNNSLKKYGRFVLGLILITVIINPFIKIFDKNFDIGTYSENVVKTFSSNNYSKNMEEYKSSSIKSTLLNFENNLKGKVEDKLKEKYPDYTFDVDIEADYVSSKDEFLINKISVGVKNAGVEKIRKINIGPKNGKEENTPEEKKLLINVKSYIVNEFKLLDKNVNVAKI